MRYQNALVLSTLAIGQAAAANHRHASFHARRSAYVAQSQTLVHPCANPSCSAAPGPEAIEWNKVVRDTVDYDAAIKAADISQDEWNSIWAKDHGGKPAATNAPAVANVAAAPDAKPTYAASSAAPQPSADKPSSAKPSKSDPAPSSKPSKSPSTGGGSDILEALGCAKPNNPTSPNDKIWIGDGGIAKMTFTNDADEDAAIFCWDYATMFSVKTSALIAVNVGAGKSVDISIAAGFAKAGCGPAFKDSTFTNGMLHETILEFTPVSKNPGQYESGAYDISRIVNTNGVVMSATGDRKCTSGVLNGVASCLYGCLGGASTCGEAGTYGATAGADTSGACGFGRDNSAWGQGGLGGGCNFNPAGDHLQVTFSNSRSWPDVSYSS
jgi:hypothetical protein